MTRLTVNVGGLVLAAGQSRRMGRPKMTLPWGNGTIVGHVAQTLLEGGAKPVVVVTGGARQNVEAALKGMPVSVVFNEEHMTGEMLSSVQVGLREFTLQTSAVLISLGDQPQIQAVIVQELISTYLEKRKSLIVPSYQMRRGHPWLVGRELWQEIYELQARQTLRDFLAQHSSDIQYLKVDTASILQDIDTQEQYSQYQTE